MSVCRLHVALPRWYTAFFHNSLYMYKMYLLLMWLVGGGGGGAGSGVPSSVYTDERGVALTL